MPELGAGPGSGLAAAVRHAPWTPVVSTLARVGLGVVLVLAAYPKLTHLQAAGRAVIAYKVFPPEIARWIGYLLPAVELAVGLLLIIGLATRLAAAVAGLLMIVFIAGIAQAWARGLSIDCGCFGGGGVVAKGETRYPQEILRDVGLLVLAAWLVTFPRSRFSLDGDPTRHHLDDLDLDEGEPEAA